MAAVVNPYIWGTGRRKTSVARVRIMDGTGKFLVNGLEVDAYFHQETQRSDVRAPLRVTEMSDRIDVWVNVRGGGKASQSGAVLLGVARAIAEHRPDLLPPLREADYLTRDARMVERKKYGHKKARKSFQFSKR